jgi:polysaccharide export outer membrane protein
MRIEMLVTSDFFSWLGRRMGRWSALALLCLCLDATVKAVDEPALYIVGPNDVLGITVYDQPQLSRTYTVQADGTLTFPLIGRVSDGGLRAPAIENELRDRLSRGYLKNPQVTVSVDQYRSQQVLVMGEVRQPGTLQFTGSMTILEALARVGSTTERAGHEAVIVHRPAGGPPLDAAAIERAQQANDSSLIRIDLRGLQTGGLSQNSMLQGGDTVFVPRADTVFVTGHVASAGEYTIRPGMTVRQVLALAGGVTDRGSTGRIQIIRTVDGEERTVGVKLQDVVQPNDTIVVRERFF